MNLFLWLDVYCARDFFEHCFDLTMTGGIHCQMSAVVFEAKRFKFTYFLLENFLFLIQRKFIHWKKNYFSKNISQDARFYLR